MDTDRLTAALAQAMGGASGVDRAEKRKDVRTTAMILGMNPGILAATLPKIHVVLNVYRVEQGSFWLEPGN